MKPCKHEGEKVYEVIVKVCGRRNERDPCFHCKLYQKVATRRVYRHGQKELACIRCEEYEEKVEDNTL